MGNGFPTWKAGAGAAGPVRRSSLDTQATRWASRENSTTLASSSSTKQDCSSSHLLRDGPLACPCEGEAGVLGGSSIARFSDP